MKLDKFKGILIISLLMIVFSMIVIVSFMTYSFAGSTHFLVTNTFSDFERGTFTNTSLSRRGEVYLVPEYTELLNNNDLYVWTMDSDSKDNIYASTGSQGKIYKITSDKNVSVFFESPGIGLNPIEVGKDDTVYLGVNPHGILYKISPEGVNEEVARFTESYIWDIKSDDEGNIFVATGLTASIYKITPDGVKEEIFSATTEKHILRMAFSGNTLYCVTSGNGLLYKINTVNKTAKVLYDTYEDEIKDLTIDSEGNVIFCTSTNLKKKVPDDFDYLETFKYYNGSGKLNKSKSYWKNSVYRVNTNETIDKLLTIDNNTLISITIDINDNIYVGTGIDGVIYKIDSNDIVSIYLETLQKQIYSMLTKDETIYASTCNMGKIFEIGLDQANEGEYLSDVFNAEGEAIWGNVIWRTNNDNESNIKFQVRIGNTETPDDTWTDWTELLNKPLGSSIGLPPSRFIQYKALFTMSKDRKQLPTLYEVKISYAMENRRPLIKSFNIKLIDSTDKSDAQFDNTKNIELSWDTEDPDNDSLLYSVYFKKKADDVWIPLMEETKDNKIVVSQRRFPDGLYDFKLMAGDGLSNSLDSELIITEYSEPFIIDSTAPSLTDKRIAVDSDGNIKLTGVVEDNLSYVARVEYSINSSDWYYLTPKDSLYDSQLEEISFTIYPDDEKFELVKGINFIQIKMMDAHQNVSSDFIYFEY